MKSVLACKRPEEICRASAAIGERNDCTVRALTVVTGAPYENVHRALAVAGRKPRKGFCLEPFLSGDRVLAGTRFEKIEAKAATVSRFAKRFPRGKFVLIIRGHATTIVDGTVVDMRANPKSRIKAAFRALPTAAADSAISRPQPKAAMRAFKVGDRVRVTDCSVKYLQGVTGTVVRLVRKRVAVQFDAGQYIGRFSRNAFVKCPPAILEKI